MILQATPPLPPDDSFELTGQAIAYFIFGLGMMYFMIFRSMRVMNMAKARIEQRFGVKFQVRYRSYNATGNAGWLTKLAAELLLMLAHFIIFFAPLCLIGVMGYVLGIFE